MGYVFLFKSEKMFETISAFIFCTMPKNWAMVWMH